MRLIRTVVLLLLVVGASTVSAQSVLFVGNSHTYFNSMPDLFASLATAGGHAAVVDQSTVGGATLAYHTQYDQTLGRISVLPWDHVILQEHSLYPAIEILRETSFYPSAGILDSLIVKAGGHTALYMTWGWELPGEHCVGDDCTPDYADYFEMQADVSAAYRTLADQLDALLFPVGEAWEAALTIDPSLPLWAADHYHPSLHGSYLAACVFYSVIYGESPFGLPFYGGLEPEQALFYQDIAGQVLTGAVESARPARLQLSAYPNPFNPRVQLGFELVAASAVNLTIYDARGRSVHERGLGTLTAGRHRFDWTAQDLPVGLYLARLETGLNHATCKLILLK